MPDEMKKNLENEELDLDALEEVSGGLVVDCGFGRYTRVRVVDDETGKVLKTTWSFTDAKKEAVSRGVSDEVISLADYNRIYGKDL